MELPLPEDDSVLVLRTDFSDDAAWEALQAAIAAEDDCEPATFVSDPAFAGLTAQRAALAANAKDVSDVFLADGQALSGGEFALLAVDLDHDPGRSFRLAPREFAEVAANFSIGNMDFADYADAADAGGRYRGFDAPSA